MTFIDLVSLGCGRYEGDEPPLPSCHHCAPTGLMHNGPTIFSFKVPCNSPHIRKLPLVVFLAPSPKSKSKLQIFEIMAILGIFLLA